MAKTPVKEEKIEVPAGTAVVPAKAAGALSEQFFAPEEMEELGGAGLDNVTSKNVLLPRLTILQALSPQVNKKKAEYIAGAEVGDWCDVAVGEIFKESIDIIPCHFSTQYIQWKKNRGGIVANLGMDASCLNGTTQNEKRQNILPNGDSIVETATWFCLLRVGSEWRRVFLPFSSTGLKTSRKWLTLIKAEKLFGKNGYFSAPLFYRPWRLKIVADSNDQGDWFTPVPGKIESGDLTEFGIDASANAARVASPLADKYKNIYHLMFEDQDSRKWLLEEVKNFYTDARDNLVIGDLGNEDPNDPANARNVSGASIDNAAQTM